MLYFCVVAGDIPAHTSRTLLPENQAVFGVLFCSSMHIFVLIFGETDRMWQDDDATDFVVTIALM